MPNAACGDNVSAQQPTTRNGYLALKEPPDNEHPKTGIPFGETGYPEFESKIDMDLDESLWGAPNYKQFKRMNKDLAKRIEAEPGLSKKLNLSEEDVKNLKRGKNPESCTWHHHQDEGKMQLVDQEVHAATGHHGGNSIWGNNKK